jgi:F-type H+-transporting ATPase subunit c
MYSADLPSVANLDFVGVVKKMKALQMVAVAGVMLVMAAPAFAQFGGPANSSAFSGTGLGAGIGVALAIVGAGYGFGRIGGAALESMARQPEIAGQIQTGMIVIAALLEGATFFGLLICLLMNNKIINSW